MHVDQTIEAAGGNRHLCYKDLISTVWAKQGLLPLYIENKHVPNADPEFNRFPCQAGSITDLCLPLELFMPGLWAHLVELLVIHV